MPIYQNQIHNQSVILPVIELELPALGRSHY